MAALVCVSRRAVAACELKYCWVRLYCKAAEQRTHHRIQHQDLLKEFPEPKNLLHQTLSKSLGLSDLSQHLVYQCSDGVLKRATVTLSWPTRIEAEGLASRKIEAERLAAAAACKRLKELGVLTGTSAEEVDLGNIQDRNMLSSGSRGLHQHEALALFSKPKALLAKVIQVATASSGINFLEYQTRGGRTKTCHLTLRWPEEMSFVATAQSRLKAEQAAAALACARLKEMGLLDEKNQPLTHVKYNRDRVRELEERERQPYTISIPQDLQEKIQQYLSQCPVSDELEQLQFDEAQKTGDNSDDEEGVIRDMITGSSYCALSNVESQRLSSALQEQWCRAEPGMLGNLPVDTHRERLVSAVEESRVTVIAGETGCGKTTRIPRFLLESRVRDGQGATCNVLVTQPRRISAVSVAQRVSKELGPALQHCVGYQVRLESQPPERSGGALLFLTVGVLLKKLQSNPTLQGVSHVVVDEVHERDVNTDLLLALLRSALSHNPQLRLVLMSATGDTQRLAQYFGECQVLHVPGFMHPVWERYLDDVLAEMGRCPTAAHPSHTGLQNDDDATPDLDLVSSVIEHIHRHGEPGALLCFLPGWQEIRSVQEKLKEKLSHALLIPLHSSLAVSEQQAVFQRPPEGLRKIVLATNIAETSITINDVVHVVDLGMHKEQRYDPRTKVSSLDTVWVSRSNVTQRRGRAGRCQPGHSYHLFPRQRLQAMEAFPVPEILRTPLENLVLQAKIHSPHTRVVDFLSQVLDSPGKAAVLDAVVNLQEIGVLDESEALTRLGERISLLSCDPRLGKVLVLASLFRCVLPLLSVAACLTRDPFFNSITNRAQVAQAKVQLSGSSCSDHLVFSRALQRWREVQRDRDARQELLDTYTLSAPSLRFISRLMQQFGENLHEAQLVPHAADCLNSHSTFNEFSEEDELVKAVLLGGLYPNLIQVKKGKVLKGGRFRPNTLAYSSRRGPVLLHRSTVNRSKDQLSSRLLTYFTAVQSNGSVFIRDSSCVHPLALLLLTSDDIMEKAVGEQVELALAGRSQVRYRMSVQTWELLWDIRTLLQVMFHRGVQRVPSADVCNAQSPVGEQERRLIGLVVELMNRTEQRGTSRDCAVDAELD